MPYIEFKPGEKYASKGAEISDTPDSFKDCGYLLTENDLVIDIDHLPKDSIKKMIEIFDIRTQVVWTDRGAHLYFKRPEGSKRFGEGICRLGFSIERKTSNNSPNGITIKRNGVLRTIENPGVREDLPAIFTVKKSYQNLLGLGDGDGRNNKLYAHKAALNGCEDWARILGFINNNVFAEPLSDKEFTAVSRQEDVQSSQKVEESDVADRILESRRCCKWGAKLWYWDFATKTYQSDPEEFKRIAYQYCVGKKTTFVDEVIKQIDYRCTTYPKDHVFKIKLRNGFLNRGQFYPIDLEEFTPYAIDLDYKADAQPVDEVDNYLTQLTSKVELDGSTKPDDIAAYRDVLIETLAFPLIVDPEMTRRLSRFFIFRGDGANGKGTLLQIIKTIYGSDNCAFLSIENLGDERYATSLIGKLVNLGDDIEDKPIKTNQFKFIKNITTADDIELRFLYKQAQHVQIQTKLIFTSNNDIRTFDKGYALKRRMYWMPMFNKVEKPDPKFITRITTKAALEYWLKLLVDGYQRLYEKGWTDSVICTTYNNEYHRHNNVVEMFVDEVGIDALLGHTRKEVSEMFDDWNSDEDRKFSGKNFKQYIWDKYQVGYGTKRVGSSSSKILMKQDETTQKIKPDFK